jgi:redox-sensitive bicupin YhaK (pirin superfamily)
MMLVRPSQKRGRTVLGWLDSYHSFSFGDYLDPANRGFSVLRVINEDKIKGQTGFPTHGHQDMEIISFVFSGVLSHKDSMGTSSKIFPGEVQRMSAGTGVEHSEFNHEPETCHLLQIWLFPKERGIAPSYEQKSFKDQLESQALTLVVSPNGSQGSVSIHQDAKIYQGRYKAGATGLLPVQPERAYWTQVIHGSADLGGQKVKAGDGLAMTGESSLRILAETDCEFLFFDLPK